MTKLEEIARAMATADWRKNADEFTERGLWGAAVDAYDLTNNSGRFHYDNLALAAVKAMREPTEAMLWAYELPHIGPDEQREAWQAMIDAIIAEAQQEGE